MKKILTSIILLSCILTLTSCSNKDNSEIKQYTTNDFPNNRILQTTCPIISSEKTGVEDPKYVYKLKCGSKNVNFETVAYDNYYFKKDTMVTFLYAKEKDEIFVLDMQLYKENNSTPYSDLHPEFKQTNIISEDIEQEKTNIEE